MLLGLWMWEMEYFPAAGIAHQTFSSGRPQEQSAHLPESESGATPARSAKAPLPQLGRLPRPH